MTLRGPPTQRANYAVKLRAGQAPFVQAGRPQWTVNGEDHETAAGDILVVKAGEIHSFRAVGDEPLVQLDILDARLAQLDSVGILLKVPNAAHTNSAAVRQSPRRPSG